MGLDLVLYKKAKPIAEMSIEEELDNELAYGRKTWAIADFFTQRCTALEGDYIYNVTEKDWDAFMEALDKLNDSYFRHVAEMYIDNCFEDNEVLEDTVGKELEDWLDKALDNDCYYQLGLDWELAAVLQWFDADEEVRKAFKDGYVVELLKSY